MIAQVNSAIRAPSKSSSLIEEAKHTALNLEAIAFSRGFAMPTIQPRTQPVAIHRPRPTLKIASIEYRIQWDDKEQGWDVLRNGVATDVVARRKRTSAVASAIRDAKAEFNASSATVVVTCIEGHQLETLWRGTQWLAGAPADDALGF